MRNLLAIGLSLYAVSLIGLMPCHAAFNISAEDSKSVFQMLFGTKPNRRNRGPFPLKTSDKLPVDLKDDPDAPFPPTSSMNPLKLTNMLRNGFDKEFMSVTKPDDLYGPPMLANKMHRGHPIGTRPGFLDTYALLNIKDVNGNRVTDLDLKLKKSAKRRLDKYLWNYTSCRVIYKWKDLGPHFWPRWIREGTCHQPERSCSIPPGMKCKQSEIRFLYLLRYICRSGKKPCFWVSTSYPIIGKCNCSC